MPKDQLIVGEVVKPHGIKGELSIACYADSPLLFDHLDRIYLRKRGAPARPFGVRAWRVHQERVLLTLEGVPDRTAAEGWRGAEVLADAADLPDREEGEVYLHELEGLRVVTAGGETLGTIRGFLDGPQEVWSIKDERGGEVLLPAVPEFVREIDLEAGVVVVDPPPGLIDLYREAAEAKAGPETDADAPGASRG